MERARALRSSLNIDAYDFGSVSDVGRYQTVIRSFIALVEQDSLLGDEGKQFMDEFCRLMCYREVWFIAEMVIPQFRMSAIEKYVVFFQS